MAKDKPTKTVDPLEAVATPAAPPAASSQLDDDFEAKPAAKPEEAKPVEEPKLPPPGAVAPPKKAPKFEVVRQVTISWGLSMITLRPGDVVSDEGYGDGAVKRMEQAGVALRELPEAEPKKD